MGLYNDVCACAIACLFEFASYGRVHAYLRQVYAFVCVRACGSVFVILSVGANVYAVCVGVSMLVAVDVSQGGRALGYSRGWV